MVCSQKSKPDPFDAIQQFPCSSGLPNIPTGVKDEGLDGFVRGRFGNQLLNFLEGMVGAVQRDWEDAFSDHAGMISSDRKLLANVAAFPEVD